jgi:peptidoglycan/xylan/chitin deacetylase (PgdA/CDA1 family)/glycosyltransferase involved in cell wall biosynthesis
VTGPLKLSVVIPTHNRREVLVSRTLPAVFEQDFPADEYEVIVVVDGSTDGTAEALHKLRPPCSLRVIEQPKRGPSAARNSGIQAAKGDLLLFLDDDIICGPHLLMQHVAAHADSEPAVVYGSISVAPDTPPSILKYANVTWYQDYYGRIESHKGLRWPEDVYLISNSSLPRATLVACGGFDENMPAKEDYELGLRLWKMGVPFRYLPSAVAYEFFVKGSGHFLHKDGKIYGRTEVLLCRKHAEYRLKSELARLGETAGWKRFLRQMLLRVPVSPAYLFTLPIWVCERLCRLPVMRQAGLRLLGRARGIVELRAAIKEAGSWKTFQSEFGRRLPVLLYHHVGPLRPGTVAGLTVSPQRFERQVRWLACRGYTGIRPSDWLRWRREGKGLPDKPVLLTFDDGYADLAEHAFPVLRRYGFGAGVFIVTGQLGGTNAWDEARGSATHRLLAAEQVRFWDTQGIEFGAHSRTHADLTTLSAQQLTEEVMGSKDDLANLLGTRVASFVYPYGFYSQAVYDCVRGAFDLALIADDHQEGLNYLLTDPYLLRRTMVQTNDSWLDLECRARWGYNPLLNLRARLRLRSRLKHAMHTILGRARP